MNQTDQTLLEQMGITALEVEYRKQLFDLAEHDVAALRACRPAIERAIGALVDQFYRVQTGVAEIALLIGDADTLGRLRDAQRRYVLDLFSGLYDLEYVNHRLRIGLVHKRIGVEPKLYLSAIQSLQGMLHEILGAAIGPEAEREAALRALDKLLLFDVTLVVETYIHSLLSDLETAKKKAEHYARTMEEKVRERTAQLEELSRTDPLTGLLNVRQLQQIVTRTLLSAKRRAEPVAAVYLDVNDFKTINDTEGHRRGDQILRTVGHAINAISRDEDNCFRCGGDEFCVILANCREHEARALFVARLKQAVAETLDGVSLSCGVAQTGPDEYVDAGTLIHLADEQMYTEKKTHKAQRRASR